MKGLINIQNEDNECFRWCLARYLNFVNKNPGKIRNIDSEFVNQPNFKGVKRLLKNRKKKMLPRLYLVMKMKHHTIFILQNKLLTIMLIITIIEL